MTSDERAWEWLLDDADLDALRELPGRVPTRQSVGPVHVEQAGSGADVVLLHAGIADRRMWDPQWVEWPRDLRVTRMDFRGFGHSERPEGTFSHGDDVLAVLDALGLERPILVGASFGGRVALEVALARPGPGRRARARRSGASRSRLVGRARGVRRGRGSGARRR